MARQQAPCIPPEGRLCRDSGPGVGGVAQLCSAAFPDMGVVDVSDPDEPWKVWEVGGGGALTQVCSHTRIFVERTREGRGRRSTLASRPRSSSGADSRARRPLALSPAGKDAFSINSPEIPFLRPQRGRKDRF